jgi:hypothetical protein
MHSIRTDFGFNLLHSASKLKRGVIENNLVGATNTEDHIEKKGS